MDTSTLFSIAPTFPMDDARIRARSLGRIARSPLTCGILVATAALGFALDTGIAGFAILFGAAAFGLRRYWEKQRSAVDAASLRELIGESNAAQDEELKRIIGHLESRGLPQYALCLGRFLLLKQKIEKDIHRGNHLALFAQEVEKGVDGICSEVCREITRIREREEELGEVLTSRDPARLERLESARRESHAAMLHAYTSLYQAHAEILGLGTAGAVLPASPPTSEEQPGKRLQEILGGLQDEADLMARTHARIHRSISEAPPVEAPRVEAPRVGESA